MPRSSVSAPSDGGPAGARPEASKTLAVVLRTEAFDLTDTASSRNRISVAMFGAALVNTDAADNPFPVLAEAVPQLNSEDWRVFPDGQIDRIRVTWSGDPNVTLARLLAGDAHVGDQVRASRDASSAVGRARPHPHDAY